MNIRALILIGIFLVIVIGLQIYQHTTERSAGLEDLRVEVLQETEEAENTPKQPDLFRPYGLQTDTTKATIDLDLVLSGGPGKDGIPAINKPLFTSIEGSIIKDDVRGILVQVGNTTRFYPYNILVWHEIVNDTINDTAFSVTFCPLCDSGIVFDRKVNDEVLQFGVSGLLFESNLLMYDTKTESLWSQARGKAVAGAYTDTTLTLLPLQVITFAEVKEKYPNAEILSTNTGYRRNYNRFPYEGYEETDAVYFPVSITDRRFFAKEPMYVIPFQNKSVVFPYKEFPQGTRTFQVEGKPLTIERKGDEIFARSAGKNLPGYFEFWFSWVTHHQDDGIVLDI